MTAPKTHKLFAFWKYDTFPFILGGEVTQMFPDGSVRTKEFGSYGFMPIKILPLKEGRALYDDLMATRTRHEQAHKAINHKDAQNLPEWIKINTPHLRK